MRMIKPGDLCVVIRSRFPENVGKQVVALAVEVTLLDPAPVWRCRCVSDGIVGESYFGSRVVNSSGDTTYSVDGNLMPINPDSTIETHEHDEVTA